MAEVNTTQLQPTGNNKDCNTTITYYIRDRGGRGWCKQ